MIDILDFQLQDYIAETFTPELSEEIMKAFELLYGFELDDPEIDFLNIISLDNNRTQADIQDLFIIELNTKLDYLLKEHGIIIDKDTRLYIKVEILSVLFMLMYLEDYTYIINIVETNNSSIEKVSSIVSEYSILTPEDVLVSIVDIDDIFISKLIEFIYSREDTATIIQDEANKETIENIKLLRELVNIDFIAYELLKSNVKPNLTIEQYLSIIGDDKIFDTIKDLNRLTTEVFGLLLISRNSLNTLLLSYRKNSHILLSNVNMISTIEVRVIELLNKFIDFKQIKKESTRNDQNRIS